MLNYKEPREQAVTIWYFEFYPKHGWIEAFEFHMNDASKFIPSMVDLF